jgi:hypothetical protein
VTDDPDSIDFARLPTDYVIKANHASGWNIFVRADDPVDPERAREECRRWLRQSFGKLKREEAYQSIPRRILFERLVQRSDGRPADDVKFYMFGGQFGYAQIVVDLFGDRQIHYADQDFQKIHLRRQTEAEPQLIPKPPMFDAMLAIAAELSSPFDAVRVDFLFTDSRFVFNELTLYDNSGMAPYTPDSWDRMLGELWQLPETCGTT